MEKPPKTWTIDRIKGSGPGGQHRNKRETGIRIKDADTNITATSTRRRSQNQNLKSALEDLAQKIAKTKQRKKIRFKTKATKSSKLKRLQGKKKRGVIKKNRGRPNVDD